jgi:prephenate dehydrogenase
VYADIQESFDGADDIAAAAERIAAADGEAFERLYREAGNEAGGFPESDADR